MSKSYGNVVDPIEMLTTYNPEIIKSYMLIFGPCLKDANFDEHEMITFHNTFVNTIGNLQTHLFNPSSQLLFENDGEGNVKKY